MLDWGTYMYRYLTCFQRNKAEVDRNKLREIEEQDERLAKIIQEQEKIKLKKAKEKKKKEQEEKSRQQVKLYLKSYLSLYLTLTLVDLRGIHVNQSAVVLLTRFTSWWFLILLRTIFR